jgi:hypothetical protein
LNSQNCLGNYRNTRHYRNCLGISGNAWFLEIPATYANTLHFYKVQVPNKNRDWRLNINKFPTHFTNLNTMLPFTTNFLRCSRGQDVPVYDLLLSELTSLSLHLLFSGVRLTRNSNSSIDKFSILCRLSTYSILPSNQNRVHIPRPQKASASCFLLT